jgi:hypothetical protein
MKRCRAVASKRFWEGGENGTFTGTGLKLDEHYLIIYIILYHISFYLQAVEALIIILPVPCSCSSHIVINGEKSHVNQEFGRV